MHVAFYVLISLSRCCQLSAFRSVRQQGATPKRRRLRDLPVRRATAASATAAAGANGERVEDEPTGSRDEDAVEGDASAATKACPVCLINQADTAIIPCGHCVCVKCLDQLTSMHACCPVCRSPIRDKLRLHFVV